MKLSSLLAALILTAPLAACFPTMGKPVEPAIEVPRDGAAICARHCNTMGLELSSVVLVSSRMGCVCAPPPAPGAPVSGPPGMSMRDGSAASALSMVIDDEAAAAAAQQAQHQRMQQMQSKPK